MEKLYQDLNSVSGLDQEESIHLTQFPSADDTMINESLEEQMRLAQTISSLTHSLRKKEKIKVRQPLSRIMIPVLDEATRQNVEHVEDLIKTEVNVKAVEFLDDTSGILVKSVKPNFRSIGQKFGPKVKFIAAAVNQWGKEEIAKIEAEGSYGIEVDGEPLTLALEDVEIKSQDIPGWSVATENKTTVALDINLTDELKQEGLARDLVNRVQNIRKDLGLEVQDKIDIKIQEGDEFIKGAVLANQEYISEETQALSLSFEKELKEGQEVEIDDLSLKVEIKAR
jgi:isoleucyl-tRNA synthetase